MDIHSVAAGPEDVLITFGWARPREATSSRSRGNVAQKAPHEEKQASSDEAISSEIARALNPRISIFKNTALSFSIHTDSGEMVVKVIDQDTGEVIRQIPPEEMMRLTARMTESVGLLMDKKA